LDERILCYNVSMENMRFGETSPESGKDSAMHYTFYPVGVCSRQIDVDVLNGRIHNLHYMGGCNGNLKAIAALCEGMELTEAVKRLSGISCSGKGTSCGDQLARNLKRILEG